MTNDIYSSTHNDRIAKKERDLYNMIKKTSNDVYSSIDDRINC